MGRCTSNSILNSSQDRCPHILTPNNTHMASRNSISHSNMARPRAHSTTSSCHDNSNKQRTVYRHRQGLPTTSNRATSSTMEAPPDNPDGSFDYSNYQQTG